MATAKSNTGTVIRTGQKNNNRVLLSDWLGQSALFVPFTKPEEEKCYDGTVLHQNQQFRIRAWGRQLSDLEQRVWVQTMALAKQVGPHDVIYISRYALMRALGFLKPRASHYEWLHWCLTGLSTFSVALEDGKGSWILPLLSYNYEVKSKKYCLIVDERWRLPIWQNV